jgi:hypothetical protein
VAELLESLHRRRATAPARAAASQPARARACAKARVCYDHLAGDLGVLAFDAFKKRAVIAHDEAGLTLSRPAQRFCASSASTLDTAAAAPMPRLPRLEPRRRTTSRAAQARAPRRGLRPRLGEAATAATRGRFTPRGEQEFRQLFA